MFTDKSKYTVSDYALNLYNIYENGYIDFNIPNEVFSIEFYKCLEGQINIEELINTCNIKLDMYLKE